MKKVLLGILVALCAVFMSIGFTACGGDTPVGSYKTVSVIVKGNEYNLDDTIPAGEVLKGSYEIHSDEMVVTVAKKNGDYGQFVYTRRFGGGMDSSGGRWTDKDGEVKFSFYSGGNYEMEYDGKDGLTVTHVLNISGKGDTQVTYKLKKEK